MFLSKGHPCYIVDKYVGNQQLCSTCGERPVTVKTVYHNGDLILTAR